MSVSARVRSHLLDSKPSPIRRRARGPLEEKREQKKRVNRVGENYDRQEDGWQDPVLFHAGEPQDADSVRGRDMDDFLEDQRWNFDDDGPHFMLVAPVTMGSSDEDVFITFGLEIDWSQPHWERVLDDLRGIRRADIRVDGDRITAIGRVDLSGFDEAPDGIPIEDVFYDLGWGRDAEAILWAPQRKGRSWDRRAERKRRR